MTPKWSPDLRKLFGLGDPQTCFAVNIRTSVPIDQWKPTNITLIGDAIHTMTPGQGVGANTALRDAARLCRNLIAHREARMTLLEAVLEYETKMVEYGYAAVKESKKQTSGDQPINKPYIGRLALAGMRTYFWLVDHNSKLQHKMAKELYLDRGGDREDY